MSTLSSRLKLALRDAGMTQADLARACGISRASVADQVTGATKSMRASTAAKAARALGVRVEWLINGIGPMHDDDGALYLSMSRMSRPPSSQPPPPPPPPRRPSPAADHLRDLLAAIAALPDEKRELVKNLAVQALTSDSATARTLLDAVAALTKP